MHMIRFIVFQRWIFFYFLTRIRRDALFRSIELRFFHKNCSKWNSDEFWLKKIYNPMKNGWFTNLVKLEFLRYHEKGVLGGLNRINHYFTNIFISHLISRHFKLKPAPASYILNSTMKTGKSADLINQLVFNLWYNTGKSLQNHRRIQYLSQDFKIEKISEGKEIKT